ncbi:hypothetical protein ACU8DI_09230 [Psychroserpens sp. BH13MA-6]
MNPEQSYHFESLKNAVRSKFLETHSAPNNFSDWDGETIVLFQEDLSAIVNAKVSEKWFYTYFKNNANKLPRIDMLHLLSAYAGFDNWHVFKSNHVFNPTTNSKRKFPWLVMLLPVIVVFFVTMKSKNTFEFCFVDDLSYSSSINKPIDIKILKEGESPLYFKTDSLGCFNYKTREDAITFVVSSPYHKTDTIIRSIDHNNNKTVKLTSDVYALMLEYYTHGNIKDWSKHKSKLEQLIHDDAQIYRLYSHNIGVEVYSKDEFVRLLTIPTKALKRIKILDKHSKNNQITTLKFSIE